MNHDVRNMAGMLRDHLASHDRPVSFLFGAGTSSAVNVSPLDATGKQSGFTPLIPAIQDLTAECKRVVEALGTTHAAAWAKLVDECVRQRLNPNIESILSRMRTKLEALVDGDSINGLTRAQWQEADDAIRKKIAELADPSIPSVLPHHDFARWVRNTTRRVPVEVFTTNYDILFERTFDELRVPHFDGFIGSQHAYFSPETLEDDALLPSVSWMRLWKLHGSVTWALEDVAGTKRISRGRPTKTGEMVLPSHRKYDESRKEPYRALMDRLVRVLSRQDSLLIACGFSFSDQHINAIVLDALDRNPRTHLVVTSYGPIAPDHHIAKWAAQRPNIMFVGPNAAVLHGRYGEWSVPSAPDALLTEQTGGLVVPDGANPLKAKVLAGDFGAFCSFLAAIGDARMGI